MDAFIESVEQALHAHNCAFFSEREALVLIVEAAARLVAEAQK